MAGTWSSEEVRLAVSGYLHMLLFELQDQRFVRSHENRALRERLDDRFAALAEFKYLNVSAALVDLGLPYAIGYLPAQNYQSPLIDELERQVPRLPGFDAAALASVERSATARELSTPHGVLVERPGMEPIGRVGEPRAPRIAKRDCLAIEAANRSLFDPKGDLHGSCPLDPSTWRATPASA